MALVWRHTRKVPNCAVTKGTKARLGRKCLCLNVPECNAVCATLCGMYEVVLSRPHHQHSPRFFYQPVTGNGNVMFNGKNRGGVAVVARTRRQVAGCSGGWKAAAAGAIVDEATNAHRVLVWGGGDEKVCRAGPRHHAEQVGPPWGTARE